jgi:hypothetical protein
MIQSIVKSLICFENLGRASRAWRNALQAKAVASNDHVVRIYSLDILFLWGSCVPVLFSCRIGDHLDWDLAIKRNSEALKGIIAGLFAMLELAGGLRWSGFHRRCTVPCCRCSARPNPPCAA